MFITIKSTTSDQPRISGFYADLDQDGIQHLISDIADIDLYCFDGETFDSDVAELAAKIRTCLDGGDLNLYALRHYTEALGITLAADTVKA